ncbi:MAG: OadG family protein [Kiritimatiellales bacterium]
MAEGFVLMVVGMSVVFAFLGLLVGAMNLCATFFIRFAHWFPEAPAKAAQPAQKTDDCTAIAVAIAAIKARIG